MSIGKAIIVAIVVILACLIGGGLIYMKYFAFVPDKGGMVNTNPPRDQIWISLDENPTTGYTWSYAIEPEGILECIEDKYVAEETDSSEPPKTGVGGTHEWKFQTVKDGQVQIRFAEARGADEALNEIAYIYNVKDGEAILVEHGPSISENV